MVLVFRFGQMGHAMKATGLTIKHKVRESSGMLMAILSKENGTMIKLTGMEFILTLTEQSMKVTGKMIFNMAMEKKFGQMDQSTKETIKRAKSMEEDSMSGLMAALMMVNGLTIKLKVMVNMFG